MYGLLNELVIPALARHEEPMQELGLHCLGLICVLDQNLAQNNMELFLTCIFAENANNQLQLLSLKVWTFTGTNVEVWIVQKTKDCIARF